MFEMILADGTKKTVLDADEMIDIEFGKWLLAQRTRHNYTLAEASARMQGISMKRLHDLENGNHDRGVTYREARLIADVYGQTEEFVVAQITGDIH